MSSATATPHRPPTEFVPAAFDGSSWANIEPLVRQLQSRPVASRHDLERWLIDRGELEAAVNEVEANLYITMTCRTDDEAAQKAYTAFIETVAPKLKPALFELGKRQIELTDRLGLEPQRYTVLTRDVRAGVEIFRQENVPIQTELEKLATEYQRVIGAMSVTFDGREHTLPQMARYQEATDRAQREGAWRAVADRRAKDADAIDGIFDRMVALRDRMGKNAGFKDFVGYAFKAKNRFDYTVRDCFAFHEAVEKALVPVMRRLDEQRKRSLNVDELRPWD
jgi:oligoendopeptidase F